MDWGTFLTALIPSILTVIGGILAAYFRKQGKDSTGTINAAVKLVADTVKTLEDKNLTAEELAILTTNLMTLLSEIQKLTSTNLTAETVQFVTDAYSKLALAEARVQELKAQQI